MECGIVEFLIFSKLTKNNIFVRMNSLNFVLLFLLILALILSLFKTGARARWAKNIRFFIANFRFSIFRILVFSKEFQQFFRKIHVDSGHQ